MNFVAALVGGDDPELGASVFSLCTLPAGVLLCAMARVVAVITSAQLIDINIRPKRRPMLEKRWEHRHDRNYIDRRSDLKCAN
jgi:hypothetical protein